MAKSEDRLEALGDQGLTVDPLVEAQLGPVGASIMAAEGIKVVLTPNDKQRASLEWAINEVLEVDFPTRWAQLYTEAALSRAEQLENLAEICDQMGSNLGHDCRIQARSLKEAASAKA